jgi:hypothetical protein
MRTPAAILFNTRTGYPPCDRMIMIWVASCHIGCFNRNGAAFNVIRATRIAGICRQGDE